MYKDYFEIQAGGADQPAGQLHLTRSGSMENIRLGTSVKPSVI